MAPLRHKVMPGFEGAPTPAEAEILLAATRRVGRTSQRRSEEKSKGEAGAAQRKRQPSARRGEQRQGPPLVSEEAPRQQQETSPPLAREVDSLASDNALDVKKNKHQQDSSILNADANTAGSDAEGLPGPSRRKSGKRRRMLCSSWGSLRTTGCPPSGAAAVNSSRQDPPREPAWRFPFTGVGLPPVSVDPESVTDPSARTPGHQSPRSCRSTRKKNPSPSGGGCSGKSISPGSCLTLSSKWRPVVPQSQFAIPSGDTDQTPSVERNLPHASIINSCQDARGSARRGREGPGQPRPDESSQRRLPVQVRSRQTNLKTIAEGSLFFEQALPGSRAPSDEDEHERQTSSLAAEQKPASSATPSEDILRGESLKGLPCAEAVNCQSPQEMKESAMAGELLRNGRTGTTAGKVSESSEKRESVAAEATGKAPPYSRARSRSAGVAEVRDPKSSKKGGPGEPRSAGPVQGSGAVLKQSKSECLYSQGTVDSLFDLSHREAAIIAAACRCLREAKMHISTPELAGLRELVRRHGRSGDPELRAAIRYIYVADACPFADDLVPMPSAKEPPFSSYLNDMNTVGSANMFGRPMGAIILALAGVFFNIRRARSLPRSLPQSGVRRSIQGLGDVLDRVAQEREKHFALGVEIGLGAEVCALRVSRTPLSPPSARTKVAGVYHSHAMVQRVLSIAPDEARALPYALLIPDRSRHAKHIEWRLQLARLDEIFEVCLSASQMLWSFLLASERQCDEVYAPKHRLHLAQLLSGHSLDPGDFLDLCGALALHERGVRFFAVSPDCGWPLGTRGLALFVLACTYAVIRLSQVSVGNFRAEVETAGPGEPEFRSILRQLAADLGTKARQSWRGPGELPLEHFTSPAYFYDEVCSSESTLRRWVLGGEDAASVFPQAGSGAFSVVDPALLGGSDLLVSYTGDHVARGRVMQHLVLADPDSVAQYLTELCRASVQTGPVQPRRAVATFARGYASVAARGAEYPGLVLRSYAVVYKKIKKWQSTYMMLLLKI